MDLSDLYREILKIENDGIRDFTAEVVHASPENSWRLPSSRDHHMKDECGEWGNLIHTLRVVKIGDCLCDILNLPDIQRDILKSSSILHDCCKHGVNAEAVWIYKEHPHLVQNLIQISGASCKQKNQIIGIIEAHMGRWGNPPIDWTNDWVGDVPLELLLHISDCVESRLEQVNNI